MILIKSSSTKNYETERFNELHKDFYKKSKKVCTRLPLMLSTMWGGIFILQFTTVIATILIYGNQGKGSDFLKNRFAAYNLAQKLIVGLLFNVMAALFGLAQTSVVSQRVYDIIKVK